MEGRARFTEEPMKGVSRELNPAIKRAALLVSLAFIVALAHVRGYHIRGMAKKTHQDSGINPNEISLRHHDRREIWEVTVYENEQIVKDSNETALILAHSSLIVDNAYSKDTYSSVAFKEQLKMFRYYAW
jgi:hypothetical protein